MLATGKQFWRSGRGTWQGTVTSVLAGALLTLPITLLSITIPLNRTLVGKREEEAETLRNAYIAMGVTVGPELLNNRETLHEMKRTFEKGYDIPVKVRLLSSPENFKVIWKMTAIQEIAREIDITLVDKYYLNAISSGVLIKAQDEGFTNDLQQAYIAIENCKTKFRQIALHFQRIISAPRNEPTAVQLAEIALRERVPAEIENAVKHMDLSLGKVEKALESLNRVLSPYGKQFTVDDSDN